MSFESKKVNPKPAVSFSVFVKAQIRAIRILSCQLSECDEVSVDLKLKAFALADALQRSDFAGAVTLSDALAKQTYGTSRSHALGNQIAYLVKKVPYKDASLDPKQRAQDAFLDAEAQCGETNRRLRPLCALVRGKLGTDYAWNSDEVSETILRVLLRARKYVQDIIGAKPVIEDCLREARFSAGTAVGVTGNCTHIMAKVNAESWSCSSSAPELGAAFMASIPLVWAHLEKSWYEGFNTRANADSNVPYVDFYTPSETREGPATDLERDALTGKLVRGTSYVYQKVKRWDSDKIFYVSKQADRHRTVGQQPLLNLLLQLGAGKVIERKLERRAGLSLKHGWVKNQEHARLGSIGEHQWCTVDLKSASDSIAIQFAKLLLPDAWFAFLDTIRTPSFLLEGSKTPTRYEKFCAMGNGFCFPLETLLFRALVHGTNSVCLIPDYAEDCAVYGDDITVHSSAALLLLEVLELCGFEANYDKTFIIGPFRESCGKDYFDGQFVRPYVQDKIPEHWYDLIHVVNSFRDLGDHKVADVFRDAIPSKQRLCRPMRGPSHTALNVHADEFQYDRNAQWNMDTQSWSWVEYRLIPVRDETSYPPELQMIGILAGARATWSKVEEELLVDLTQDVLDGYQPSDWRMSSGLPELPLRRETRVVKVRVNKPAPL